MKSIKQLRCEAKLTQEELAQKLGVHQTYISKLEIGIIPWTDGVLQMKLSQALEVPLSEIPPCDTPCHRHFPTVVHNRIVYNLTEFYDAVKRNADRCKSCRDLLEKFKEMATERFFVDFLHSLTPSERRAYAKLIEGRGNWREELRRFIEKPREKTKQRTK